MLLPQPVRVGLDIPDVKQAPAPDPHRHDAARLPLLQQRGPGDAQERQRLLQLLVERITVEDGRVRVEAAIPAPTEEDVQLRARHPEPVEGWPGETWL